MTITQGVETKTLKELKNESGRSSRKILDDVVNGNLKACIQTLSPVVADDHIKRGWMKLDHESGEHLQSSQARVLWITSIEAGELRRSGKVEVSHFEYPVLIDSFECPAVKRYKQERAIFLDPYTATMKELCFLDGDAAQYISRHTGKELVVPEALSVLPKIQRGGGSFIVYRLFIDPLARPAGQQSVNSAPKVGQSKTLGIPSWNLRKPQRFQGYTEPLYDLLNAAHLSGSSCPSTADVLTKWKDNPPNGYGIKVVDNMREMTYHGNGMQSVRTVDCSAITKTIKRMIKTQAPE